MLSRLLGEKNTQSLIVTLYCFLALGVTFNKIILSLATIFLFLVVILDFNFENYKQQIKGNNILKILLLFLGFHFLSLFWTDNDSYFFKDLNSKLPFYAIPLIFVLKPIKEKKHLLILFTCFLFSLLIISALNLISYYGWRKTSFDDIRSLSLFESHIRFGLMLVFGTVLSFFWLFSKYFKWKIIPAILIPYFLFYTYISEVGSSYISTLFLIYIFLIFKSIFSKRKIFYLSGLVISSILLVGFSSIIMNTFKEKELIPKQEELKKFTAEGNLYEHDLSSKSFINGNHVYSYICQDELFREWHKKSDLQLMDTTTNGFNYYYILIQYLTSKGLKKDAVGFNKLTNSDIKNIESGIHKFKDDNDGFFSKIKTLKHEFENDDPNGKTILQRVEYLKTGWSIFRENWIIGVGSGDLPDAFKKKYVENDSLLKEENKLRTHNQILTYFISFGIIGGSIFLFIFIYYFRKFWNPNGLLPILFISIILVSFLSEDTLETQVGGTFFGLFFGLFISSKQLLLKFKQDEN